MESNISKGDKTHFSHFVQMTLQNKMQWKTLSSLLIDLAPTLNETREIISILLKELEVLQVTLQKKEKLLKHFHKESDIYEEIVKNLAQNTLEDETIADDIKSDSTVETETIVDDIEVLEVVKECFNEEMYFQSQKGTNHSNVNEEHQIDSTNEDLINSVSELDNEWYTFVSNDKDCDLETETAAEIEDLLLSRDKKRPFQCTICEKCFQTLSNLKNHERIHTGEVPFECMTCKKRFNQTHSLKTHERIHTGEVPFECNTCTKRFNRVSNLKTHQRIHTGEVPFECMTCKKRFNKKSSLKIHEMIHTGEVPYECGRCKKRFKRKDHLKQHEISHTQEKPHECKTCKKTFKHAGDLKRHERIHTGEVPFECGTCNKRFKQIGHLKYHERNHRGEKHHTLAMLVENPSGINPP